MWSLMSRKRSLMANLEAQFILEGASLTRPIAFIREDYPYWRDRMEIYKIEKDMCDAMQITYEGTKDDKDGHTLYNLSSYQIDLVMVVDSRFHQVVIRSFNHHLIDGFNQEMKNFCGTMKEFRRCLSVKKQREIMGESSQEWENLFIKFKYMMSFVREFGEKLEGMGKKHKERMDSRRKDTQSVNAKVEVLIREKNEGPKGATLHESKGSYDEGHYSERGESSRTLRKDRHERQERVERIIEKKASWKLDKNGFLVQNKSREEALKKCLGTIQIHSKSCLIMQPFNKLGFGKPFIINTIRCPSWRITTLLPTLEASRSNLKDFEKLGKTIIGAGGSLLPSLEGSLLALLPFKPNTFHNSFKGAARANLDRFSQGNTFAMPNLLD
ncbi:hypothetical protein CR513_09608, partial [Mucuna pruriens]